MAKVRRLEKPAAADHHQVAFGRLVVAHQQRRNTARQAAADYAFGRRFKETVVPENLLVLHDYVQGLAAQEALDAVALHAYEEGAYRQIQIKRLIEEIRASENEEVVREKYRQLLVLRDEIDGVVKIMETLADDS